ncbi:adenosylcobinamide-GDP ribazoletransferase [Luteococcus sp. Sow4_B9]|uniref:adenosylcobinamide-GDP ribazoletransferase n=1 Tax=Luteococcus sp. Sow4_B9 TaxID=3438792 RepID=UPI003F999891
MKPLTALRDALGMFTLLPVPPTLELDESVCRRIMLAFPWAGLVCGLAAGATAALVVACGAGDGLAAMAGLAALTGITGAMHIDGVADTADGLASRKGPEDALALMKKSDIGPMGVATAVLVLLLQAAALASASLGGWSLVAALVCLPMVGRIAAVLATVRGTPGARPGGFGALFTGITSRGAAALDVLAVLTVTALAGWLVGWLTGAAAPDLPSAIPAALAFTAAAGISWLVAARWQRHLLRRLGGLTGDTFGSLIEVCQTTFVVGLALLLGLLG